MSDVPQGEGWWQASDGRWYPPTQAPGPLPPPPPPGPGPFHQPPYGYGAVATETNGMAIASLVLGLVWMCGLGSILALVFGYQAKGQIDRSNGTQTGRGLAVAGIVLGWIGVAVLVVYVVLGFAIGIFADPDAPVFAPDTPPFLDLGEQPGG
jgi:hypothetical protein